MGNNYTNGRLITIWKWKCSLCSAFPLPPNALRTKKVWQWYMTAFSDDTRASYNKGTWDTNDWATISNNGSQAVATEQQILTMVHETIRTETQVLRVVHTYYNYVHGRLSSFLIALPDFTGSRLHSEYLFPSASGFQLPLPLSIRATMQIHMAVNSLSPWRLNYNNAN